MSSTKSQSVPSPESVHDVWLSQRAELERDLFDGWAPAVSTAPQTIPSQKAPQQIAQPQVVAIPSQRISVPVSGSTPRIDESSIRLEVVPERPVETDKNRPQEWLKQANAAAVQHKVEQQQRVTEALSQQREVFFQDLAQLRANFERELSDRETAWTTKRDQEWAALCHAKEVQAIAQQQVKEGMSAQHLREREEMLQWRRQAEVELAEAHRLLEQERLKQQQELARQREEEMAQRRRDREEFDARVRQIQSELAYARQRHEEELRQARDVQLAQLRAERVELDKLRDTLLEKFRREQVVLENGMQFFGQHLSRVSEELNTAKQNLQSATVSASETRPTEIVTELSMPTVNSLPMLPTILSLDEIRERLNELKKPQRTAA